MSVPEPDKDGVRYYGHSHLHKKGFREDKTKCVVEVMRYVGRWPSSGQCARKRGFGPEGLYCRQHDPKVVAEKEKIQWDKYEQDRKKRMLQFLGPAAVEVLRKIASGCNDARGAAIEFLEEHKLKLTGEDESD